MNTPRSFIEGVIAGILVMIATNIIASWFGTSKPTWHPTEQDQDAFWIESKEQLDPWELMVLIHKPTGYRVLMVQEGSKETQCVLLK